MLASRLRGSHPATVSKLIVLAAAIVSSVGALLFAAPAAPAVTKPVAYDYVVLIDTSKSMVGYRGTKDIFPKVKHAVNDFVGALDLGPSVVYLYSFDSGLKTRPPVRLVTASDKAEVKRTVDGLVANGMTTAIYTSLGKTLRTMGQVRRASPGKTHVQTILLFTDGRDNQSGASFDQISRQFRLAKAENPYLSLMYVTLGTTADPRWRSIEGVDVVANPPGSLPQLQSVRVQPVVLDFGSLQASDTSERVMEISFDKGLAGAPLGLSVVSRAAENAGGLVSLEPSKIELQGTADASGALVMKQTVRLRVDNRESLDQSARYSGRIDLAVAGARLVTLSPPSMQMAFTMAAEPQITIAAAQGDLNGDLGLLDPYVDDATVNETRSIRATFSNSAETVGTYVTARLVRRSGPNDGSVVLKGGGGQPASEIKLTPDQPLCTVVASAAKGQAPGVYVYALTFEPSGASLSGVAIDPKTQQGVLPIRFSVPAAPPPPTPVWKTALRWFAIGLVGLVGLLVVGFFALCLITGSGPAVVAALLLRKLKPRLQDARVEVTLPVDSAKQYELSGEKLFDIGPEQIPTMPFVLRFAPHISISDASDEVLVSVQPAGGDQYLRILRTGADADEVTMSAPVVNGDVLRVDGSDGERCEMIFKSFSYINV